MRISVGEEIDPSLWAPLPEADRLLVGGRTTWLGPFDGSVVVAQPNRWGQVEDRFPDVPCVVEADPLISGLLPLPTEVTGWLDRAHRPIDPPVATPAGKKLLEMALRLAKMIDQIGGVRLLAPTRGRTVAFTTPVEPSQVMAGAAPRLDGLRPLAGVAGGLAVAVRPGHSDDDLVAITAAIRQAVENDKTPSPAEP